MNTVFYISPILVLGQTNSTLNALEGTLLFGFYDLNCPKKKKSKSMFIIQMCF